jgi:cell division protein FtsL
MVWVFLCTCVYHLLLYYLTVYSALGTSSCCYFLRCVCDEKRTAQLNSTQLNSTQLNSTQLNSTQHSNSARQQECIEVMKYLELFSTPNYIQYLQFALGLAVCMQNSSIIPNMHFLFSPVFHQWGDHTRHTITSRRNHQFYVVSATLQNILTTPLKTVRSICYNILYFQQQH